MEQQLKEVENSKSAMQPIDEMIDSVFQQITEEEKEIASKFDLNEKDIRVLCRKKKCAVQMNYANLLKGIEKKILKKEPQLKSSKKLQIEAYKWHKNHPRSSKKYCDKAFQLLSEENSIHWRERKVNDLITLGIHPKLLTTTYKKYGNFNKAIKYLEEFDSDYISSPISSIVVYGSDTESEHSQITVINTQESENVLIKNELININQNYDNENYENCGQEIEISTSQNDVQEKFEECVINNYELTNTNQNYVNENTEKSVFNTEELINFGQNYVEIENMNLVFNSQVINESNSISIIELDLPVVSEEIIGNIDEINSQPIFDSQPTYDQFNFDRMMLTSTQKI